MTWDLKLDPLTRDLKPGIVTGADEIVQRLITRLKRELGEWFLATDAGLPWYQDGNGILGAKGHAKQTADMLIRREALNTEGVERVLRMNTLYSASARTYSIYMEVVITGGRVIPMTLEVDTCPQCGGVNE